jgi:autotransporter-associated beta strand protein
MSSLAVNWTLDNNGNWNDSSNWDATFPDAVGAVAIFTNNISADRVITLNQPSITVGTITLGDSNNSHSFNIGTAGDTSTLIFESSTGTATINESGSRSDRILVPMQLNSNLTLNANAGSTGSFLSLGGAISEQGGSRNILKTGSGSAGIFGNNSFSGTVTIRQGLLQIAQSISSGSSGPLGNSTSAIVLGDASTPDATSVNSVNIQLEFQAGSVSTNFALNRDIDATQTVDTGTTNRGRSRIRLIGNNVTDNSTLAINGNIAFDNNAERRYEIVAQRANQRVDLAGDMSGAASTTLYLNGSNTGVGTIRFSDRARSYAATNLVSAGTVIVQGSVPASGVSPIGTGALNLTEGASPAINQNVGNETFAGGGLAFTRSLYLDTPGTAFERNIFIGGAASFTISGVVGNNVLNGYKIGGLNTSGVTTFSGSIISPLSGTAADNGDTNLALFAADGGVTVFSGSINDNGSTTRLTLLNINQFVNHTQLTTGTSGTLISQAGQPVGTPTQGTVVLSGPMSYEGTTTVRGGTLLVNTVLASTSQLSVSAGAILGGTGSVNGPVSVSGRLAPGSSIDSATAIADFTVASLSFEDASTLRLELNTNLAQMDRVLSLGALALASGPSGIQLELADLGTNAALAQGTALTAIDYGGSWNGGLFSFAGNPLPDDSSFTFGANTFSIDYNGGDGTAVVFTVIPEANAALAFLGSAGLLACRRRRLA